MMDRARSLFNFSVLADTRRRMELCVSFVHLQNARVLTSHWLGLQLMYTIINARAQAFIS